MQTHPQMTSYNCSSTVSLHIQEQKDLTFMQFIRLETRKKQKGAHKILK